MAGTAAKEVGKLSARQIEVLALVAQGLTNLQIAAALNISIDTVRSHVSAILRVLGLENRTEAANVFFEHHAKSPGPVRRALSEPAIAVGPILPLSASRSAARAATALTRDLVALFSRRPWFPVIALCDVEQPPTLGASDSATIRASKAVGGRFVVTGSLRTAADSFRLEIRVTDTSTARTIWTDIRDFPAAALFDIQDEMTGSIVAQTYARLLQAVSDDARTASMHPRRRSTWELAHASMTQLQKRTRATNRVAEKGFRAAIEREPGFVLARFGLGLAAYDAILNQWDTIPDARALLCESAVHCIELAPHMAEGHFLEARSRITEADYEQAATSAEAAIRANPSFAAAHALLAQVHTLTGKLDEGLARMQIAKRLGPRAYTFGLAVVHFARHEWEEASAAVEQAVAAVPKYPFGRALAAASADSLGDTQRAKAHVRALYRADPTFDARRFRKTFGSNIELVDRISDTLRSLR